MGFTTRSSGFGLQVRVSPELLAIDELKVSIRGRAGVLRLGEVGRKLVGELLFLDDGVRQQLFRPFLPRQSVEGGGKFIQNCVRTRSPRLAKFQLKVDSFKSGHFVPFPLDEPSPSFSLAWCTIPVRGQKSEFQTQRFALKVVRGTE